MGSPVQPHSLLLLLDHKVSHSQLWFQPNMKFFIQTHQLDLLMLPGSFQKMPMHWDWKLLSWHKIITTLPATMPSMLTSPKTKISLQVNWEVSVAEKKYCQSRSLSPDCGAYFSAINHQRSTRSHSDHRPHRCSHGHHDRHFSPSHPLSLRYQCNRQSGLPQVPQPRQVSLSRLFQLKIYTPSLLLQTHLLLLLNFLLFCMTHTKPTLLGSHTNHT